MASLQMENHNAERSGKSGCWERSQKMAILPNSYFMMRDVSELQDGRKPPILQLNLYD